MVELHQRRVNFEGEILNTDVIMKKPASEREFATWCAENKHVDRAQLIAMLYTLPELIYEFMMKTGHSVRFDRYGIIKIKELHGKLYVAFRNHPELARRLMDETYLIKHYDMIDGQKVIKGGRMSTPYNDF